MTDRPTDKDLQDLIAKARERFNEMSPEQQAEHLKAQQESFSRAETAFGSDAEEAKHRAAWASGDPARIAKAAKAEAERLARFDRLREKGGAA